MKVNKVACSLATLAILFLGGERPSTAAFYSSTAHVCEARDANSRATMELDAQGTTNGGTGETAIAIWCPFTAYPATAIDNTDVQIDTIRLNYYDGRNDDAISAQPVVTTTGGTEWWGDSATSCSTAGGCSTPSNGYVGYGYLEFTGNELPNDGSSITDSAVHSIFVILPPEGTTGGNGPSYVMSIVLEQ